MLLSKGEAKVLLITDHRPSQAVLRYALCTDCAIDEARLLSRAQTHEQLTGSFAASERLGCEPGSKRPDEKQECLSPQGARDAASGRWSVGQPRVVAQRTRHCLRGLCLAYQGVIG